MWWTCLTSVFFFGDEDYLICFGMTVGWAERAFVFFFAFLAQERQKKKSASRPARIFSLLFWEYLSTVRRTLAYGAGQSRGWRVIVLGCFYFVICTSNVLWFAVFFLFFTLNKFRFPMQRGGRIPNLCLALPCPPFPPVVLSSFVLSLSLYNNNSI